MTEFQMCLLVIIGTIYTIFGFIIAVTDACNKEILTPRDFYNDKYNWFGSWVIFIVRILLAAPFYIIVTICALIYKIVKWLFTVGR